MSIDLEQSLQPVDYKPVRKALAPGLLYILSCTAYIWISGQIASGVASDAQQLAQIEVLKGTAFVVVTGLLFFIISLIRWRRIKTIENTIVLQQRSLLQSERKAVAGMYAASIAHDLNNLLMSLFGLIEEIKKHERADRTLSDMRDQTQTAIKSLQHFAKRLSSTASDGLPSEREDVNISEATREAAALAARHPDVRYCRVSVLAPEEQICHVNRALLEDAVTNLIVNAAHAAGATAEIEVRVAHSDDAVVLQVHDNGPGVPMDLQSRIFDPCFTTKSSGSGLGLMAVKAFAHSHGGAVTVSDSPLGGALFEICLPLESVPECEEIARETTPR